MLQVNPQVVPSQVAVALGTAEQGTQDNPQVLALVFCWQVPLQSWVPVGHTPMQTWPVGMQLPAQSLLPVAQVPPQTVPSQVAVPPTGTGHAVHDEPHEARSVLLEQPPPQT